MKIAVFSSKSYDKKFLNQFNHDPDLELVFIEGKLDSHTAGLCRDYEAISVFVNDVLSGDVIEQLHEMQVGHIALRCAGFNNLDIDAAKQKGISVSRVPDYSPVAVAEHTVALMQTLNRKLHKAYNRVKEANFSLEGLLGFNLQQKTVGLIGTGRIGIATAKILHGYGCELLCYDKFHSAEVEALGARYVSLESLFSQAEIISLHCPLNEETRHLINADTIAQMREGVMIINTSRGGLIDTQAVVAGLKSKKIAHLGLDVYEMESELFFEDKSLEIIQDDLFQRLSTFPNVLITAHQGFFTQEAMANIAQTTLANLALFRQGQSNPNTFLVQI
ncbi:D-lactate dehydrogenase [Thalassocella blandensis]|nr:D-lactate dehydrogenase [Thalassocella blandensis]